MPPMQLAASQRHIEPLTVAIASEQAARIIGDAVLAADMRGHPGNSRCLVNGDVAGGQS